jgi:putative phosphoesterase
LEVLILSDSHGYFDEIIKNHASGADEIWHAGDIGDKECLFQYEQAGKLRAVSGNIDGIEVRNVCPQMLKFEIEGLKVLMTHIAFQGKQMIPSCAAEVEKFDPHFLVYGHSHITKIWRPMKGGKLLAINPGAVGRHGFHIRRTMVRVQIEAGSVKDVRLIDLGPRSIGLRSDI